MRVRLRLSWGTIVKYSLAQFYFSEVFGGPIRYYFSKFGLVELIYLPKVEISLVTIMMLVTGKILSREFYVAFSLLLLYLMIGLLTADSQAQAPFAFWIMVPFLFSIVAGRYLFASIYEYRHIFFWLYVIVLAGILLNCVHNVPWAGSSFSLGGKTIANSRAWTTFGIVRISGFGKASFSAASQAVIFSIFILHQLRSKTLRMVVWAVTGFAVVITTSKGVVLAYVVLTVYYWVMAAARRMPAMIGKPVLGLFNIAIISTMCVMIILPITTMFKNFHLDTGTVLKNLIFASFQDRLDQMWPQALTKFHSGLAMVTGKGLGAMGTAEFFFDPLNYNSGDNLFVYVVVQYGFVLTFIFLALLLYKFVQTSHLKLWPRLDIVEASLLIFLIVYGCFSNEFEDGVLSSAIGLCLAYRGNAARVHAKNQTVVADGPAGAARQMA
jgi:hypothetical protein